MASQVSMTIVKSHSNAYEIRLDGVKVAQILIDPSMNYLAVAEVLEEYFGSTSLPQDKTVDPT